MLSKASISQTGHYIASIVVTSQLKRSLQAVKQNKRAIIITIGGNNQLVASPQRDLQDWIMPQKKFQGERISAARD